jgi:hypothetical protein
VDATTPSDKAVPWNKIRVEGDQPFYLKDAKKPTVVPGIFELWIHDTGDSVVLIGWRAPVAIDAKGATAATANNPFAQMTTQGNPDFSTMPSLTAGTLVEEKPVEAPPAG